MRARNSSKLSRQGALEEVGPDDTRTREAAVLELLCGDLGTHRLFREGYPPIGLCYLAVRVCDSVKGTSAARPVRQSAHQPDRGALELRLLNPAGQSATVHLARDEIRVRVHGFFYSDSAAAKCRRRSR